jgi:DNA-binding CsgD family transcriptional regulator
MVHKMTAVRPTSHIAPSTNVVSLDATRHGPAVRYQRELSEQQAGFYGTRTLPEIRDWQNFDPRALREVFRGVFSVSEDAAVRIAGLTPRQHEIMDLVLAGEANKIIAWKLGISQRTVENHRACVMRKTGSASIPALARLEVAARWDVAGKAFIQLLTKLTVEAAGNATNLAPTRRDHADVPADLVACPPVYIPAVWNRATDSLDPPHLTRSGVR